MADYFTVPKVSQINLAALTSSGAVIGTVSSEELKVAVTGDDEVRGFFYNNGNIYAYFCKEVNTVTSTFGIKYSYYSGGFYSGNIISVYGEYRWGSAFVTNISTSYTVFTTSDYPNTSAGIAQLISERVFGVTTTYPIVYVPANCQLSGPAEAASGDDVSVLITPDSGYSIKNPNQGANITVYNKDGYVPFTYSNNQINFTMP